MASSLPGPAVIVPYRPIRRCIFPTPHFQPRTGKSRPFVPQKVAEEAEDAAAFRTFDGLLVCFWIVGSLRDRSVATKIITTGRAALPSLSSSHPPLRRSKCIDAKLGSET